MVFPDPTGPPIPILTACFFMVEKLTTKTQRHEAKKRCFLYKLNNYPTKLTTLLAAPSPPSEE
jgi:hypothetical protein